MCVPCRNACFCFGMCRNHFTNLHDSISSPRVARFQNTACCIHGRQHMNLIKDSTRLKKPRHPSKSSITRVIFKCGYINSSTYSVRFKLGSLASFMGKVKFCFESGAQSHVISAFVLFGISACFAARWWRWNPSEGFKWSQFSNVGSFLINVKRENNISLLLIDLFTTVAQYYTTPWNRHIISHGTNLIVFC